MGWKSSEATGVEKTGGKIASHTNLSGWPRSGDHWSKKNHRQQKSYSGLKGTLDSKREKKKGRDKKKYK